jgi:hypothetical protein
MNCGTVSTPCQQAHFIKIVVPNPRYRSNTIVHFNTFAEIFETILQIGVLNEAPNPFEDKTSQEIIKNILSP